MGCRLPPEERPSCCSFAERRRRQFLRRAFSRSPAFFRLLMETRSAWAALVRRVRLLSPEREQEQRPRAWEVAQTVFLQECACLPVLFLWRQREQRQLRWLLQPRPARTSRQRAWSDRLGKSRSGQGNCAHRWGKPSSFTFHRAAGNKQYY